MPEEAGAQPADESPNEQDGGVAQARLRVPPWAPEVTFQKQPGRSADPESAAETTVPWAWQHGSGSTRSRAGSRTARLGRFGEVRYVGLIVIGACLFATAGGLAVLSIVGHSQPQAGPGATYVPGADGLSRPQVAIAATSASTHSASAKPSARATTTHTVTVLRSVAVGSAASAAPILEPTPNRPASAAASSAAAQVVPPPTSAAATTAPAVAETGTFTGYDALCLDDWARRTVDGNQIIIEDCNGTPAQSWTVQPGGTMQVEGMCMDVPGDSPAAGSLVELWTCDGAATQVWRAGPGDTLVNTSLKLCLDDPDSSASPGTGLDVAACTDGANQQWIFDDD